MIKFKRAFSLILSICVIVTAIPQEVHATELHNHCEHHTEHTDACGFIESHEGTACNHNHTDDCYTEVESTKEVNICSHTCTDEELSISDNNGVCNHICDDNCISIETEITKELNCQHTDHTDDCGYSEGIEGVECSHECNICKLQSLVDSLQDGVSSDEEKSNAEASLTEIDTLKSGLSDEELSQVDFTKYTSLINALNTYYTGSTEVAQPMLMTTRSTTNSMSVVYTKFTDGSSDVGNGTEDRPFNYFKDALNAVIDGGTIYIMGNARVTPEDVIEQNNSDSMPYIINKQVTVESTNGVSYLSVDSCGIILGADVTFNNIQFSLPSAEKNAIFANGHRLEIVNGGYHSGGRNVHIFAGGVLNSTAYQGSNAQVIINGTSSKFGNVYGGSMDTSFNAPVSINISNIERLKIGAVYASGAQKGFYNPNNLFGFEDPEPPAQSSVSYPSTGKTTINLTDAGIDTLDGLASTGNKSDVTVIRTNDNLYPVGYSNVGNFTISQGVIGLLVAPDKVTIGSNGTFHAVSLVEDNYGYGDIYSLHGEQGSKLVVPKDGTLIINTDFTGIVELKTDHYQGITDERTYVEGSTSYSGEFTYTFHEDDYNKELVKKDGDWVVQTKGSSGDSEAETTETKIASFSFVDTTFEADSSLNYVDVELSLTSNNDESVYISDTPLSFTINHNNNSYTGTSYAMEYAQRCEIEDLNLMFDAYDYSDPWMSILILDPDKAVSEGTYIITVTIPGAYTSSGTDLSSTLTLVVGDSGGTTSCEHTPAGDYHKDDATHWKICSKCGEAVAEEIHTPKDDKLYTVYDNSDPDAPNAGSISIGHANKCICGEYINIKPHDSASNLDWEFNTANHYKLCQCGYELTSVGHVIVTSMSDDKHHWQGCECGYIIGEKEAHTPKSDDLYDTGDGGHGKKCKCGKTLDIEPHTFDSYFSDNTEYHYSGCKCGRMADGTTPHASKDGVWYSDENTHYQLCVCGEKLEESEHDEVNSLDWQYSSDSTEHYKVCSCGKELARESHSKIEGKYESDSSSHWGICECGHIVGDKVEHDYKFVSYGSKDYHYYGHKEECIVCNYAPSDAIIDHSPVDATYYKDDSTFEHYQLCVCGEELNREKHEATDTYTYDEKSHYKHCICGQQLSREDHKPGAEATETSDQVCLDCNYVIVEMINHEHDWGTWTSNGDNTHTRVCKTNSNHTETLACSGGVATCKDKATCTTCNEEYGNLNSSKHVGKTEVRDKTSTYTGDTYCLDCNTKIATGKPISSGSSSGSSSSTGGSSSSSNQNSNNSSSGSSSSSNTTSENTNKSTNMSNNTITNTGNNNPEKATSTLTTNKPVIVIEEYTIKRGDTLSKIARRYGCTLEELINANKDVIKNPNLIHIGWKLNIPTKKVESESNSINGVNNTTLAVDINNSESYVIQQGDNLWKISRKYGCTIEELLAYNVDTIKNPNLIIAGKKLRIPKR